MSQRLSGLGWNISEGPCEPRASKLRTTATCFASGCWSAKALAPMSPVSSASVKTKRMSLRSGGPVRSARSVSSIAATPAPSSDAPGEVGTES
ncbi:hypothetical protein COSO111634_37720 [Corallococcus soli]